MSPLPEPLPAGEKLLWQGKPDWRVLAVRSFHLRGLAIYFGLILAWCLLSRLRSGSVEVALVATLRLVAIALVPLVLIAAYAWMTARATTYIVTTRRVILRVGLTVPMSINLPFSRIESAGARVRADGSGDIALLLAERGKLGYFVLWPHARPWRMGRPEPMLRGLADAGAAAQVLARGLAASACVAVQPLAEAEPRPAVRAPASHATA